ncbi:RagB/SusD family nutrient uptake outer membrane protein [Mucilaginibacter jinjuensis]|uniref:RagB/SusD family nutrient uptake outer membrane protein n=1 Tax=Mucilaginibacter jinjuensis TaxID=1176721 RepID=A0ABY7TDU1_9SPHI|nr:RagB/SusD family nutrient uptake outer membrane protein [Mucilaginibacter jinjuensis]WCT14685.1 RagB/SusD family nutrient uptake outer membrane protein [Mucilaginibacter jinjuensis]
MKPTYKILLLTAAIIGTLSSCKKLNENPDSVIVSSQFYKTASDANSAVNAVYSTLNSDPAGDFPLYGRQLNLLTDNAGDDQIYSPSNTNPDVRALGTETYISSNSRIQKVWQQLYYGINRANIAIDNIPAIQMDTATNARLVRESKFIRALLYFNLVRLYGDVPLILHNPTSIDLSSLQVPRTNIDTVYSQIITDLKAATNLPKSYTGANIGRATGGAAHALLAKVYVTRKQWANALTQLNTVINGGYGYALFPNFRDAFQKPTKNGVEHIFSVQFETNLGAVNSTQYLSQSFVSFNTATFPIDIPADSSVYKLYSANDTRRAVTFYSSVYNAATGQTVVYNNAYTPYYNKFVDYSLTPLTTQAQSGINYPVIRYSDVLLLYAEVQNELNGAPTPDAYASINKVRTRAGIANLTAGLSQASFRDSVFLERRKEFIQEGNRWFDLVRQGETALLTAVHKLPAKSAASSKNILFPIPLVEVQLNPLLKQNPGY